MYLVTHPTRGQMVVKELRSAQLSAERTRLAARNAGAHSHPNVVACLGAKSDGVRSYWGMEYLAGVTLGRLVRTSGPLAVDRAVGYARQIALGLEHLHRRGLVHADLKPENVVLTPDGTVKLIDVEGAYLRGATPANVGFRLELSTTAYAPPERVRFPDCVNVGTDIYGLGAVLYYLLTGHAPCPRCTRFGQLLWLLTADPKNARERRPDVPSGLADLVHRILARDPTKRLRTATEVFTALTPFAGM